MNRHSISFCFALVLIFSWCNPVASQASIYGEPFIPDHLYEDIDILNTNFSEPMSCGVSGTSGEFSFESESDSLILNWTHEPGVELEYSSVDYHSESEEYVYFYQDFFWDQDVLPTSCNVSVTFDITTSGTFHNVSAYSLFDIYAWLISPTGWWDPIATFSIYGDGVYDSYRELGSWATNSVFEELISGSTGNSARIAIGLIPSWRFQAFPGDEEPWRYHNGTVLATFSKAGFSLLVRTEAEIPATPDPLYQTTWANGISDSYQDSSTLSSGISYTLTSEDHENLYTQVTLTKLDPRLDILWQKSWNETSPYRWYRICAWHTSIYLLGAVFNETTDRRNMCLMALDPNGEPLWVQGFHYYDYTDPIDLQIDGDGNVYIIYDIYSRNFVRSLIKVESTGSIIWDGNEIAQNYLGSTFEIEVQDDGGFYVIVNGQLRGYDETSSLVWAVNGSFMALRALSDGSVVAARLGRYNVLELLKYDDEGRELWMNTVAIEYEEGWYDYYGLAGIAEKQDGTLFFLVGLYGLHPGRVIFHYSSEGIPIANYTVALSSGEYESYNVPQYIDIEFTSDNLMYLFGRAVDENWDYSIVVAAFGAEPLFFSSTVITLQATIAAAGIIVVTIVILQVRNRSRTIAK